ncbi:hypothetical protein HYU06_06375 [Candidatus Woesearchaeota archaeon]|nr:hypothetical protein [Candidatus Woesearchaeota archaeon]
MKKIHGRHKRLKGLSRTKRHGFYLNNIKRHKRPKTFHTEQSANAAAEKLGLKQGSYTLVPAKKNKKLMIKVIEQK